MTPELSSAVLRAVLRAAQTHDEERCGLLWGRDGAVTHVEETRNVAAHPRDSFEIDPAALIRAHRLSRRPDAPALLGCWHTHPSGEAAPSLRDAACAAPDGMLWLIAAPTRATLWRAVATGAVHGRFEPVRFDLHTGKHVDKAVAAVQRRGPRHALTTCREGFLP